MKGGVMSRLLVWWVQWGRRWRLAEMRLLFWALVVSMLAVSSVGFFTDRVDRAMLQQASRLLGGDLVISSPRALPGAYREQAAELGLQQADTVTFSSMASAGDKLQLSMIKAVSNQYPLEGQLAVSEQLDGNGEVVDGLPEPGHVWAEVRLFRELGIAPGASIQLGRQQFVLSRVLTSDPSRGTNLFQLAPQIIMNQADVPATGLLTPASRANYSLLFSGEHQAAKALRLQLEDQLQAIESIQSLDDGVPTVQQSLQRAGRFLGLAALLSVVLAGAAISLTSSTLVRHEARSVAVLKAFGLSRRNILVDYLLNLWFVATVAAGLGLLLGFGLQYLLGEWLAQWVEIKLPSPGGLSLIHI